MRSVSRRLADLCGNVMINLGRVGDNLHTQVRIDCLKLFEEYPNATAELTVRPPKGDPYPAVIVRDGDIIVWNVTDSDLIYPGTGEAQLVFTAGDVVAHRAPFKTMVERSIVPTGTVPDPVTNWIEEAEEVLEEVRDAIPEGGTTNQVLAKASNDDYDLKWVDQSGGGGGTSDYDQLSNRPQIGGVTLTGNKSLHDLGAAAESDIPDVSGKADKVTNGTENNFAALDANGNLKDSGHKHSDYLTSHQDISGKADKVSSATSGNFAGLDGNGNLTDSGKKASDFLTQHQDISGKSDLTNLAPAFAEGTANDAGTYVTYDGKVYLLPSGHTAGTTWANTTKTETKIGTELSGVKSEIQQKISEPETEGTDGQVLTTDGNGGRSWTTPSGGVSDVKVNGTSVVSQGEANVPLAGSSNVGVVKVSGGGLQVDQNGQIRTDKASENGIKDGTNWYAPIVPFNQHQSVFYALAKLAGADMASLSGETVGVYPDAQKVAIQKMLGIYEAPWELIREDTVTNATEADIEITVDGDGNAFELTDVILMFETPKQYNASAKGDYGVIKFFYNNNSKYLYISAGAWTQNENANATGTIATINYKDGLVDIGWQSNATSGNPGNLRKGIGENFEGFNGIRAISDFSVGKINITKVTGTGHYKLYGKRKWTV